MSISSVGIYAQQTRLIFSIEKAFFEEWNTGGIRGDLYTTKSVSFYAKQGNSKISIGTIYTPDKRNFTRTFAATTNFVPIPNNSFTLIVEYNFRFRRWGDGSDNRDYTKTEEYTAVVNLDNTGKSTTQTIYCYDSEQRNSYVTFSFVAEPYQPEILPVGKLKCYDTPFTVSLNKRVPSDSYHYSEGYIYYWEYSDKTKDYQPNQNYRYDFLYYLSQELENKRSEYNSSHYCYGSECIDYYQLQSYILDYMNWESIVNNNKSMCQNWELYDWYYYDFADLLLQKLLENFTSDYNNPYRDFFNNYFSYAFYTTYSKYKVKPYVVVDVYNWKPFANTAGTSVTFDPQILGKPTQNNIIFFRARPYAHNRYGSYSQNEISVDIKPGSPKFNPNKYEVLKSCPESSTGTFKATDLSSVLSAQYAYFILDKNASTESALGSNAVRVNGKEFIASDIGKGEYKAILFFESGDYRGCYDSVYFTIDTLPKLRYNVVPEEVQCNGGNDGKIMVAMNTWAGDYSYRLIDTEISNTPTYTFTGLSYNNYDVVVKDGCKEETKTYEVKQPEQIAKGSISTVAPTCTTPPNGSVIVSGTTGGSSSQYNYEIYKAGGSQPIASANNQGANWTYTGLESGDYTLVVRDAARPQCSIQEPFTINSFAPLTLANPTPEDVTCYGKPLGKITARATGGGPDGYVYSLAGQNITNHTGDFSGLYAGTYTVEVKNDNEYCLDVDSKTVVVSSKDEIRIVFTTRDITCKGDVDGSISASVTGGTNSYLYSWSVRDGSNWEDYGGLTANQPVLPPGEYRLTVRDGNVTTCEVSATATVKEPERALSIQDVVINDIRCLGDKGNLQPNATGGYILDGYTFNYKSTGSWQPYLPGGLLTAGTYRVQVSDRLGCTFEWNSDLIITEPAQALTLQHTVSDFNGHPVRCSDSNDGVINGTASGGNGASYQGYKYAIDNGAFGDIGTFDNLPAGTYTLKTRDARLCEVTKTVVLTAPAALVITPDITHINCYGLYTGKIIMAGSGGIAPYQYTINDREFSVNNTFATLPAGDYVLKLKDLNNCTYQAVHPVNHLYDTLRTTLTPVPVRCHGENNGEITLSTTGGSGTFTWIWQQKTGDVWTNKQNGQNQLKNLVAGEYRLLITDMVGCPTASDSSRVEQPESPITIAKADLHDIVCLDQTGSIDVEAVGGNDGYVYSYSKNNGAYQNYSPGSPLLIGSYKLRAVDAKGCQVDHNETLVITQPDAALNFTFSLKDYNGYHVSCFGNDDGEIQVTATGGNGAHYQGYTYDLDDGEKQVQPLFASLFARTYQLAVEDARGCRVIKPVTLTEPAAQMNLWVTSVEPATCHYDSNGAVNLAASGGAEPYRYNIDGSDFKNDSRFDGLAVARYHFTVRDRFGCGQVLDTAVHYAIPKMVISELIDPVKCYGENSGAITIQVAGGALPLSPVWRESGQTGMQVSGLYTGTYHVKITDNAGCIEEGSFEVGQPAMPLSVTTNTAAACAETQNGSIWPAAQGGTAPYMFAVDDPQQMVVTDIFQVFTGNHTVYVTDNNNCKAQVNTFVDVRNKMPSLNFAAATDRYVSDTLVLKDISWPLPDSVHWSMADMTILLETGEFDAVVHFPQTGSYPVVMTGYFGTCSYSIEKSVNISPFDPATVTPVQGGKGIESVILYPNPNNGQFTFSVKLFTKQQLVIRVNNIQGQQYYSNKYAACTELEDYVSIPSLVSGVYIFTVIAENDMKVVRFVVE